MERGKQRDIPKMRDYLHSDVMLKNNIDVFNDVYEFIDKMIIDRKKLIVSMLNITDKETMQKIEDDCAKHLADDIIEICNKIIHNWKHK